MAKRYLDDSLLTSPSLAATSPRAQDAWPRLILCADDFGCMDANPRVLTGRAWPLRPDVGEADVAGWLDEFEGAGMLRRWTEDRRVYCVLTGWFGAHGQRDRGEYDAKINPRGSRRKTPQPPPDTRGESAASPQGSDLQDGEIIVAASEPRNRRETAAPIPDRSSSSSSGSQSQTPAGARDPATPATPPVWSTGMLNNLLLELTGVTMLRHGHLLARPDGPPLATQIADAARATSHDPAMLTRKLVAALPAFRDHCKSGGPGGLAWNVSPDVVKALDAQLGRLVEWVVDGRKPSGESARRNGEPDRVMNPISAAKLRRLF